MYPLLILQCLVLYFFSGLKFTAQTSNWPTVSYKSFHFAPAVGQKKKKRIEIEIAIEIEREIATNVLACFSGRGKSAREMLNGLSKSNFVRGFDFYLFSCFASPSPPSCLSIFIFIFISPETSGFEAFYIFCDLSWGFLPIFFVDFILLCSKEVGLKINNKKVREVRTKGPVAPALAPLSVAISVYLRMCLCLCPCLCVCAITIRQLT